jgi:hypothetical protein
LQLRMVLAAFAATFAIAGSVHAQVVQIDTSHGVFYEAPLRTHMFVYSPSLTLTVNPSDSVSIYGGWEADIVSGASVKTKAGPAYKATHPTADVISTASVNDFRNVGKGGFAIKHDNTSFGAGGLFGSENDYHSISFNVMARTELFEHNTQLQIDYARNFDQVCDAVQDPNANPVAHLALSSSKGCFTKDVTRLTHDIGIDSLQGSWSQAWTPVFQTQAVYTLQILNGFQSDPYRAVVLGQGVQAQEYIPDNRTRHAVALRANYYLRAIKGAIRVGVRGYRDSWNIYSGEAELEVEKYFGSSFRAAINGRFYKQTGAIFWSDDYSGGNPPLGPRGQYFTGDRELSPFFSVMGGIKLTYAASAGEKKVAGFLTGLRIVAAANIIDFNYDEYTLGGVAVAGTFAYLLNLGLSAGF